MAVAMNFGIGAHKRRNRSTVGNWLALRPEFSPQARMPPTALLAPRGERRGSLVLTAGPVPDSYGRYPTGPVAASRSDWPREVLALFLAHDPGRGTRRPEDDEAARTQFGSAQARRVDPRSWVAAALAGDRCPTTLEHPAIGQARHQSKPTRSARPPLRLPNAIARLAGPADARISDVWLARRPYAARKAKPIRPEIYAPSAARSPSQSAPWVTSAGTA